MTRVVHIRSSAGFYGAERVLLNLLRVMPSFDVEALLVSIENYITGNTALFDTARAEGVTTVELPCRGKWRFGSQKLLNRHIGEFGAQCIHTHDYKSHLFGYLSARKYRIPIVATLHGWTRETARLKLYELIERFLLRRFDAVIAVSPDMAEQLVARGLPDDKVVTIANAVDTEQFQPAESAARHTRFGFAAGNYVFGTIGRLSEEKGQDVLLKAFAEVVRECPAARLLLIGDGPQEGALRGLTTDLGIQDAVVFAGVQTEIEQILPGIDCYVSPSWTEGMPMIILEAMACQRPIIATKVGAVGDLLDDGAGFLLERGDLTVLAQLMISTASGSVDTSVVAAKARKRCVERYGLERQAQAYTDIYSAILGSGELAPG